MPAAAFALNENLRGALRSNTIESVVTVADDEDAPSSLCNTEMASVEDAPRHAIPELGNLPNEPSEICTIVGCEKSRDIFQHEPPRSSLFHKVEECECEG
jgi:hypothetical protein